MSFRTAVGGFTGIAIIALTLVATHVLEPLDRSMLGAQFTVLRAWWPQPAAREVVIVGIDEETTRQLPEPVTLWHKHLGRFLQAAAANGAAAVGVDIVLPDRSYDGIVAGHDKALFAGILAARRVTALVLALTVDSTGRPRPVYPVFIAAAGSDASGYALLPIDNDGVVRRYDERLGTDGGVVPTFAGQLARRLGASPQNGLIDFAQGGEFTYLPLHTVLAWYDAGDAQSLRQAFAGKPVLLGSVLKFEDGLVAPVNLAAWDREEVSVPGVVLHAQVLRNMLGSGLISSAPAWTLLLLCLVAALAWLVAADVKIALGAVIAGSAVIAAGSTWLLARGWHLPPAAALATLILAAGARTAYAAALEMRERRKLRHAFSGYVSPPVMDEILAGQINPELGGVTRFVCVLFSDIRGYTARSERMAPQQVIAFLNRYFEQVVNLIHARGGTVASFMGDGIIAVFGAPKPLANPCAEAFAAAREMLEYVRQFNADSRAAGEVPIEIGVGLHGGDAVVGHVGSSSRHDYTVIGDVSNVASRLEGVTKEVGYRLVCSKVVADQLSGAEAIVPLGPQSIKGHSPVEACGYDKV